MHLHHRIAAAVGLVGLVVGICVLSGSSSASLTAHPSIPKAAPYVVPPSATYQVPEEQGAADQGAIVAERAAEQARAEADAIAALNAAQAQALADQLQAAADRLRAAAPPSPPPAPVAVAPAPTSADCFGVNSYAAFIYQHESGCRTDAVNGGGCAGIGQACPGSKLPCSLSDAPCQLQYFESYALGRYGSWEAAYQFWISRGWW